MSNQAQEQDLAGAALDTGSAEGLDPFDRLYKLWGEHALSKNLDPPSRERWDFLVLRLLLSKDPVRINRYRNIESQADESLGADAYALWQQMPPYTPNLTAKAKTRTEFQAYEQTHRGAMRRYMEEQGLLDMYETIIEQQKAVRARARRAQASVVVIGCIGMSLLAFMVLTVLLIIALKSL